MRSPGLASVVVAAVLAGTAFPAEARRSGETAVAVETRSAEVHPTGLSPRFPEGVDCAPVSSPYGSPTRYDGSRRPDDRNGGRHGGMDLSLAVGTPLLAVADGEVIALGRGGRMEGNFVWLRIAPEASGLPFWTFAKYQHLDALPNLQPGDRVRRGAPLGPAGRSGTQGGHYGREGYAHLHLSTRYGPSPDFEVRGAFQSMVSGADSLSGDPMLLYLDPPVTLATVLTPVNAANAATAVPVSVVTTAGAILEAGRERPVWPVACARR